MRVLYFTSTGNSLYVARQFADYPECITHLINDNLSEITDGEAIGIVVPDYVSDIPAPVRRFLTSSKLKAPYIFGIITYGSMCCSVVDKLASLQTFDYINTLKMVDNYYPLFNQASQITKAGSKHTEEHLADIKRDITTRRRHIARPGVSGRINGWLLGKFFPLLGQTHKRFRIDTAACNKCGICAKVCPANNITFSPYPAMGEDCIMCGACRQNCPQNAIRYRGEHGTCQYRHPDITLKDIVESNDR